MREVTSQFDCPPVWAHLNLKYVTPTDIDPDCRLELGFPERIDLRHQSSGDYEWANFDCWSAMCVARYRAMQ
jgi:hypothetical protein